MRCNIIRCKCINFPSMHILINTRHELCCASVFNNRTPAVHSRRAHCILNNLYVDRIPAFELNCAASRTDVITKYLCSSCWPGRNYPENFSVGHMPTNYFILTGNWEDNIASCRCSKKFKASKRTALINSHSHSFTHSSMPISVSEKNWLTDTWVLPQKPIQFMWIRQKVSKEHELITHSIATCFCALHLAWSS